MSRSVLPTIPLVIFGIIEPALLVWGYISGTRDPFTFFADQAPNHSVTASAFTPQSEILTLQIINIYALVLAPAAVACSFTRDAFTAKVYLFFVALADWGHMYAVYKGVGPEYFWNVQGWNNMVAGGVGVSAALNVFRWATLLGLFGSVKSTFLVETGKKRA
ncbi:hypothetical protein QBC47DRAFT_395449 [Echria macrotheca]|uniref:DUF7704 domain-containing protein n=1 Tax=Echria macrotheca TaxID=438768 RepID=A0AAJ0B3S8_9PEZI|nr:hypothetical protein QBC47DRAFT_395449 [Echria macrotheca]